MKKTLKELEDEYKTKKNFRIRKKRKGRRT